jgi:HEAT repeat protein
MKRRWGLLGAIVLAVVVLAAWLEPTQSVLGWLAGEPFHAGRPLRYWTAQLSGSPGENAAALEVLSAGERSSVEPLLIALYHSQPGDRGAELRWTALELLGNHAPLGDAGQALILAALDDDDAHVRSVAAGLVPKVGIPAERGVSALIPLLDGPHNVVAARALSEYRGAAAPALESLVVLMHNASASVEARWNAARTIGKIGPDALPAVPELIAELDNPEDTIREHAAEAIGDIGPVAAELGVPALRRVLNDRYVKVRRDAVRSLGYIGPAAREAVDEILPLLNDPEELVRVAAREALQKIVPEHGPETTAPPTSPPAVQPD